MADFRSLQTGTASGVGGHIGADFGTAIASAASIAVSASLHTITGANLISTITNHKLGRFYVLFSQDGFQVDELGNLRAGTRTITAGRFLLLISNGVNLIEADQNGAAATITGVQTLTNKTINLASNTIIGTKAQFDAACSNDDFAYIGTANVFSAAQTISAAGGLTLSNASAGYKERGRTVAIGEWINVAHNAANYTASAGAWVVDLADHVSVRYALVGKMMTLSFRLFSTDVSATPAALRMAIPGGFTAASTTDCPMWYSSAGAAFQIGLAQVSAGQTVVEFYRDPSAATNWATTALDNTVVRGQITFEIQ